MKENKSYDLGDDVKEFRENLDDLKVFFKELEGSRDNARKHHLAISDKFSSKFDKVKQAIEEGEEFEKTLGKPGVKIPASNDFAKKFNEKASDHLKGRSGFIHAEKRYQLDKLLEKKVDEPQRETINWEAELASEKKQTTLPEKSTSTSEQQKSTKPTSTITATTSTQHAQKTSLENPDSFKTLNAKSKIIRADDNKRSSKLDKFIGKISEFCSKLAASFSSENKSAPPKNLK